MVVKVIRTGFGKIVANVVKDDYDMAMRFTKEEIAALRQALGMTLSQFADLVGVTTATASRWEAGLRFPSRDADEKLEEIYSRLNKPRRRQFVVAAS